MHVNTKPAKTNKTHTNNNFIFSSVKSRKMNVGVFCLCCMYHQLSCVIEEYIDIKRT